MTVGDPAAMSPDTIVLIHGLWVTARSWEDWVPYYRQAGYEVLAPSYPGLEIEVEALRADPSPVEELTIEDTAAHYERIIRGLEKPPIMIGHSFGGTVVQLMLDRGLGAAGVAIASLPVKGVRVVSISQAKSVLPVLGHVSTRHKAVQLSFEQFRYAFCNASSEAEARAAYERYHVGAPGRIVWDCVLANLRSHPATEVDFAKRGRAPLLFIAGGEDHLMPPAANRSNYKCYLDKASDVVVAYQEFAGRAHFTLGQHGWQEVADFALTWAEKPGPYDSISQQDTE
jgi:pimeloyl-ACP methyl ester carboxylesterase